MMKKFAIVLALATVVATNIPKAYAGCFQAYVQDVNNCANLSDFIDRSACGLDAAVTLAGCVRRGVLGL